MTGDAARRVPFRFAELRPVLTALIGQASKARPHPCADGLYDVDTWRRRWEEAAASPAVESGETGMCPYQGLAAFSENDANLFFGRERSVTALLMRRRGALDGGGVVMLVGASGAGKSSLINAGLVPALARGALPKGSENWPVVIITPGTDPLDELGGHVPELAEILDKARTVRLTKDQVDPEIADGAIAASRLQSRVRTACAAHQLDLVAHQLRPRDNDVYTRLIPTRSVPLATPLAGHGGAGPTGVQPQRHDLSRRLQS